MAGLATVRARIADDLNRNDLSTQIDTAINRAIEYYESENFWFKDTNASFSLSSSQTTYTSSDGIPTNIGEIDYVEISINANTQYEVNARSLKWIQDANPSDTLLTGYPTDYALYDEEFYFYPTPNSAYAVTVFYKQKYDELSSDSASNNFTVEALDLIESRARYWIYTRIIMDHEQAAAAKVEERDALQALSSKTEKLKMTNQVRRHTW